MIHDILKILDTTELQELEKQRITTDLLRLFNAVERSEQLLAISDLKDFAYEVCPLHREDDLEEIIGRL